MSEDGPPSRVLLIIAGALTQLIGLVCLVLALASLPIVHDLHRGMQSLITSLITAVAAIVCGTLVWRGRLVPLALAAGVDIGFGIVLPRGGSAISVLLRILPADDGALADHVVTALAIAMFATAALCVVALPSALALRKWALAVIAHDGDGDDGIGDLIEPPPPAAEAVRVTSKMGSTLRGFGPPGKLVPTQIVDVGGMPRGERLWVIGGSAVTVIAIGLAVIGVVSGGGGGTAAGTGSGTRTGAGTGAGTGTGTGTGTGAAAAVAPAVVVADAAVVAEATADASLDAAPSEPALDDFVAALHVAIGRGGKGLDELVGEKAFAFGVDGHAIAEGRAAIGALVARELGDAPAGGFAVEAKFHQLGRDGDCAWLAEELRVGSRTYVMTAVVGLDAKWTIAALHLAQALANDTAYRLAREGTLVVPDAIPDAHDDSPLAVAMRTAFASKPSFVEARSTRADAFNFGSAPGERIVGGDAIKKTFARLKATIRLHDAVKVGTVGARGGWGAANVEFTDADKDGTAVTQTFRVLAAFVKEDAGWRIVQTQWSNAR